MIVNMHEAKTNLSKLVARAAAGEEIVISRAGTPMARLVGYRERRAPRVLGQMAGKIRVAPDFDETDDWLIKAFEGEEG